MKPDAYQSWEEVVETLEEGGLTDRNKYPEIFFACKLFWETSDYELIEGLINDNPWLLHDARRNIREKEKAEEENPFRPFPEGEELDRLKGQFDLGYVNYQLDMLRIDPFDTTNGFLITGAQGTGKSYPCLLLLDKILRIPVEERGFNVFIIQGAKRDTDGFILKYPETFKIIEWDDLRYNLWQVDDWDTPIDKLRSASTVFAGENFLYTLTLPILNFAVKDCFTSNGVFDGSMKFPIFKEIDRKVHGFAEAFQIKGYEIANSSSRLRSRLIEFMDAGEVLNCRHGFPLEFFLENDMCLNVKDVSEFLARTTIMNILADMQRYYEKHPSKKTKLRTLVVLDEARWLFDVTRDKMDIPSNKIVERWFTTSREAGIGRIIITQEPQSISRFVTDNCALSLTFPVYGESLESVKKLQNLTEEQARHIFKLNPYGEGVFRHPNFDRPFIIQIPPHLDLDKAVTGEQIEKIMRPFIEELHSNLEPVKEIKPIDLKGIQTRALMQVDGANILGILKDKPFIHYTLLRDTLKIPSDRFKSAIDWLIRKGLITTKNFRHSKTKLATYMLLTEKAHISLDISTPKRISPSHFRHSLYCERIKIWLQDQGYTATREFNEDGDHDERIDVYAEREGIKTGYEVTLTVNARDVIRNVTKCLHVFNIDELVLVCENKEEEDSVIKIIADNVEETQFEKITFTTMSEFL